MDDIVAKNILLGKTCENCAVFMIGQYSPELPKCNYFSDSTAQSCGDWQSFMRAIDAMYSNVAKSIK